MSTPLNTMLRFGRSHFPSGQRNYTTEGSFSWVVPVGVTSVSVACVANGQASSSSYTSVTDCRGAVITAGSQVGRYGGGTRFENDIPVTPGETITVNVGATSQFKNSSTVYVTNRGDATPAFDGGGNGGVGGAGGATALFYEFGGYGGHGGAGGLTGNGGVGADAGQPAGTRPPGTGDGGQGGDGTAFGPNPDCVPIGASTTRTGNQGANIPGVSGERGVGGSSGSARLGVVRIIWPGTTRQYPSTRVADE